jgi:sortase A
MGAQRSFSGIQIMANYSIIPERISLFSGIALLALAGLVWIDGIAHSRSAIADFERIQNLVITPAEQSTWSEGRKAEYQRSLSEDTGTTLAILRTPSTGMEVPVFDSLSNTALNRGAGHVESTALPGSNGNIAIAGHRDGFFRSLQGLEVGAEIEVTTLRGSRTFHVTELRIVDPLDVSVLEPTEETMLTLITCYPFYFVGPAPERFIVRAKLQERSSGLENQNASPAQAIKSVSTEGKQL